MLKILHLESVQEIWSEKDGGGRGKSCFGGRGKTLKMGRNSVVVICKKGQRGKCDIAREREDREQTCELSRIYRVYPKKWYIQKVFFKYTRLKLY